MMTRSLLLLLLLALVATFYASAVDLSDVSDDAALSAIMGDSDSDMSDMQVSDIDAAFEEMSHDDALIEIENESNAEAQTETETETETEAETEAEAETQTETEAEAEIESESESESEVDSAADSTRIKKALKKAANKIAAFASKLSAKKAKKAAVTKAKALKAKAQAKAQEKAKQKALKSKKQTNSRVSYHCPPKAAEKIRVCQKILRTFRQLGGFNPEPGMGEEWCQLRRFDFEEKKDCALVHDHFAEIALSWDVTTRITSQRDDTIFCANMLAEPVQSIAILSPRTERKCLGAKTKLDDLYDNEDPFPEDFEPNILEAPFHNDVFPCGCKCKPSTLKRKGGCKGCPCAKGKKRASKVSVKKGKKVIKARRSKPLPPRPRPATCDKKSKFTYSFPYSQYLADASQPHIVADINLQLVRLYQGGKVIAEYPMSSSEVGIGSEMGSAKTPVGQFEIKQLVGEGAVSGADFKGLKPTTKFSQQSDKAAVQTRVLVLNGLDANNKNTLARKIYIHGTNKKKEIGRPTSQGCLRLSNDNIIDLFNRVKVGTRVYIVPKCAWPSSAPIKVYSPKQIKKFARLTKTPNLKKLARK